ncbi:MAG: DUF4270 family protein [Polaribacter sp.]
MKNIIRKCTFIGVLTLIFSGFTSCEEEFTDLGTNVVSNTKFSTGKIILDVAITTNNTESVRADNIGISILGKYWLGVYNKPYAKKMEASIISQLTYVVGGRLRNKAVSGTDTTYTLDKVLLKIPNTATSKGKDSEGKPTYTLDSVLGNPTVPTSLVVLRNGTYLSKLNPADPTKENQYLSNYDYLEKDILTETGGFTFMPKAADTLKDFLRVDRMKSTSSNVVMYRDTIRVKNTQKVSIPFLAIPLDLTTMKTLFWNKFEDPEFSSAEKFQQYFRGLIIKAQGTNGALVPFNLGANPAPVIDFYYSKTISENNVIKDTINSKYSFSLAGYRNSKYNMSTATVTPPADNFVIQGTAGSTAEIKILGVNLAELKQKKPTDPILKYQDKDVNNDGYLDLKELASIRNVSKKSLGLLINDASLIFNVNKTINTNKDILPQRLLIYQNKKKANGSITPTHISDSYEEAATFGGNLSLSNTDKLENYTFKISDYISNLLDKTTNDFSPLELKVYNTLTDDSVSSDGRIIHINVRNYNWNPKSVVLLNGNKTANGEKRVQLKISYSERNN